MTTPETCATFCRICEAQCGVLATVEGNRIVDVRADPDTPHSQGFMCVKARAMLDVVDDPDRVLQPLRRVGGPGEFEPCSWDEALDDIAARLKSIVDTHGGDAFATYTGNPTGFDPSGTIAINGLRAAIGSPWNYATNGEDHGSFVAATALQYGSTAVFPRPDLWRTNFLLMAGANPWISKGSIISEPQIRRAMKGIVERGGRVVVVDPRRTETARNFEHVPIRPGTDSWLLLGIARAMIDENLTDDGFLEAHTSGYEQFAATVLQADPARCAQECGIPHDVIAGIARDFAAAPAAAAYGRTGTCTQRFGTLTNLLLGSLNIVTGNVNRPGGVMFGWGAVDFQKLAESSGNTSLGAIRSRTHRLPSALGSLPSQCLGRDITEPGPGRVRALCTYSANPVSSSGAGGQELAHALEQLDLHFSLDLYVTETNRHAHYVLPAPTFYERADIPFLGMAFAIRPTLYATDKVIEPRGASRPEWQILNEIARRMGLGGAYPVPALRWLAKLGLAVDPMRLLDLAIRTAPVGDLFGLRRTGWSLRKLRRRPHGIELADHLPVARLERVIRRPEKKIRLAPSELPSEVRRLFEHTDDPSYPLRAVGIRELHSHNSWMHNSPRLVPDGRGHPRW